MIPKHIYWSVNKKPFATFREFLDKKIKLENFDYQIKVSSPVQSNSFRQECINAAKLLPNNLAIPVSGSDSEIVARSVHALGKTATIYYEHYPWADKEHKVKSKELAKELGYQWIDYEAEYDECLMRMEYYSVRYGQMFRGFLITLGLFEKIPKEQFIVGALGELEKDGFIYRKTMINCFGDDWDKEIIIPCPSSEILWWFWGKDRNRVGQYTFFNSTLPLIKSAAIHPLLSYGKQNKGVCNTMKMKNSEWPELIYKTKTDHFHPTDEFYDQIYQEMKKNMFKYYSKNLFSLVNTGFCGFVNYSKLFN